MRQFNIFRPLYMAFYSKALYRDVGQNWLGTGLLYLLLLVAICSLPFSYNMQQTVKSIYTSYKPVVAQVPIIAVKDGTVSIDKPEPYYIKDLNTGRIRAVIDTTGTVTTLENSDAYLLLTKNKLILKEGVGEKTYVIPANHNRIYTATIVDNFLQKFMYVILLVLYPAFILLFFLEGIIEVLFYSLLAKLFIHTHLTFKTLFRLTAIAVTPAFILAAVFNLFAIKIPFWWLFYILIAVGYLIFAIKANWDVEKTVSTSTQLT